MDLQRFKSTLEEASILEIEEAISSLSTEELQEVISSNEISGKIKAVGVLNHFSLPQGLDQLSEIGNLITRQTLLGDLDSSYMDDLNLLFNELVSRIIDQSDVTTLNYYSSLDEYEDNQRYSKIAGLLSFLQTNYTYETDQHYSDTLKLYEAMTSSITDPEFILLIFENLFYKPHQLINPIKKQLTLLYSQYLSHEMKDDEIYFNYLISKKYPFSNLTLIDLDEIPFDVIYNILKIDLFPQQKHDIMSQIEDQERLINLIQVDNLVGSRDLLLKRLNSDSILRLINDYKFLDIIHLIETQKLHELFYEVEYLEAKAIIARKLKSNTLAFEVLQQYFEDYGDVYLTSDLVRDLFVLLKLKQLALFRLSLPSEYHQLLRDMIREKERQERNDNSMFA